MELGLWGWNSTQYVWRWGEVNLGFQMWGNVQRSRGGWGWWLPIHSSPGQNLALLPPSRVMVLILKWIFTGKVTVLNFKRVYRVLGGEGVSH